MKKWIVPGVLGLALLAGCGVIGNGTNHDAANPPNDWVIVWHRIETPPKFQTMMFGCFGTDGIMIDQGDTNATVTPNDPMCPANSVWMIVQRNGDDPPVVIATKTGASAP